MARKPNKREKVELIVRETVERFAAEMERTDQPFWQRGWVEGFSVPTNGYTRKPFSGGNLFWLWFEGILRGYASNIWMTYDQGIQWAREHGRGMFLTNEDGTPKLDDKGEKIFKSDVYVRKGEKGVYVLRPQVKKYTKTVTDKVTGEEREEEYALTWFVPYTVFNLEQFEGISEADFIDLPKTSAKTEAGVESYFAEMPNPPQFRVGGGAAYYHPKTDTVTMPDPSRFHTTTGYYLTKIHEYLHSTGHKSRLNRKGVAELDKADRHDYSYEELVVCLGTVMTAAIIGLPFTPDNFQNEANYARIWASRLRENTDWLQSAAVEAERAVRYFLNQMSAEELAKFRATEDEGDAELVAA